MAKKIFDLAPLQGVVNRCPSALGPGVVRVAAEQGASDADVFVYGDIGGYWDGVQAEDFAKEVAALDVTTINVRLNSPGGLVFDGLAIYNALARHAAKTVIHIEGIAASIASVIAMAGDEILIYEGSSVMIHKPWSIAIGDALAMRKEAEVLDELEGGLIDIYEARTDQKRSDLEKWVGAETWFRGQKAVDNGFADRMVPAKKKDQKAQHARSAMLPLYRNTPQDLMEPRDAAPQVRELERLLRDGEGLSHAQARRVVALARASLGLREEVELQPKHSLRDEGAAASKLAAHIRTLV